MQTPLFAMILRNRTTHLYEYPSPNIANVQFVGFFIEL